MQLSGLCDEQEGKVLKAVSGYLLGVVPDLAFATAQKLVNQ
jgi:hypothetical protein